MTSTAKLTFGSAGWFTAYWVTMRPYLLFVSGAAGLVGVALSPGHMLVHQLVVFGSLFLSYGFGASSHGYISNGHGFDFRALPTARPRRYQRSIRPLVELSFVDDRDRSRQRCFAVSASVGAVARANTLFNSARGLIGLLKPHSPELAIAASAVRAVLTSRNQRLRITSSCLDRDTWVTNLSIAKTRHLAGSLTYDEQVTQNDGLLAVNLCEDMSRLELLSSLRALQRGKFSNRPKTLSFSTADVSLEAPEPFEVEIDGEALIAKRAHFEVLPQKVRVCS